MAVKINATAPGTSTFLSLADAAAVISLADGSVPFAFAAWVRRDANTGSREEAINIAASITSNGRAGFHINSDIPQMFMYGTDYAFGASTLAVGDWIYMVYRGITIFAGDRYYGSTTTLTNAGSEPQMPSVQIDSIRIGRYTASDTNQFRGSIAHFRIWSGANVDDMTQANFEAEMVSTTPVHTENLWGAYEFVADATDTSGNGHDLTVNGSDISYVAGPIAAGSAVPVFSQQRLRRR